MFYHIVMMRFQDADRAFHDRVHGYVERVKRELPYVRAYDYCRNEAARAKGLDCAIVARFDSSDGYPAHPREAAYRAAQVATLGANGEVVTSACGGGAYAQPPADPQAGERWWQQYSSCASLKRSGLGHPTGPFSRSDPAQAEIYEWFAYGTGNRGDGDNDGLACEGG